MKIRIKGNSIRYRLTQSEVNTLDILNPVTESVDFGSSLLVYSIYCSDSTELSVTFNNNEIRLEFPVSFLKEWKTTEKVGYSQHSGLLSILLEKDFTCLDNVDEDQSDNFPNPLLKNQR